MSSLNSASRCQHTKIDGTPCRSPAVKPGTLCFFHARWCEEHITLSQKPSAPAGIDLPVLEDPYSIQVVLAQVMRLLLTDQIDSKKAGLLLYALQTASSNLSHMAKRNEAQAKSQQEEDNGDESASAILSALFGQPCDFGKLREDYKAGVPIEALATLEYPESDPRSKPKSQPQAEVQQEEVEPVGTIQAVADDQPATTRMWSGRPRPLSGMRHRKPSRDKRLHLSTSARRRLPQPRNRISFTDSPPKQAMKLKERPEARSQETQ